MLQVQWDLQDRQVRVRVVPVLLVRQVLLEAQAQQGPQDPQALQEARVLQAPQALQEVSGLQARLVRRVALAPQAPLELRVVPAQQGLLEP